MSQRVPWRSNTVVLKVNMPVESRTLGLSRDCPQWCCLAGQALHSGDTLPCHCQARASAASPVNGDLSTRQAACPRGSHSHAVAGNATPHVGTTPHMSQSAFISHVLHSEWTDTQWSLCISLDQNCKAECTEQWQPSWNVKPDWQAWFGIIVLPFLSSVILGKFLNFWTMFSFYKESVLAQKAALASECLGSKSGSSTCCVFSEKLLLSSPVKQKREVCCEEEMKFKWYAKSLK